MYEESDTNAAIYECFKTIWAILVDDKHSVEWHITEFEKMVENMKKYNQMSHFLLGDSMPGDVIHEAKQESWIDHQLMLDTLI